MPSPIDELVKRRVIEQWISGFPRDKIASDLQIGAGTVSNIVSDFKKNLQGSDIDSLRVLAVEVKKQGLSVSELAVLTDSILYDITAQSYSCEKSVSYYYLFAAAAKFS
jgi:hypothetical protein